MAGAEPALRTLEDDGLIERDGDRIVVTRSGPAVRPGGGGRVRCLSGVRGRAPFRGGLSSDRPQQSLPRSRTAGGGPIDLGMFGRTALSRDPFDFLVVPRFVPRAIAEAAAATFPR